MNLIFQFITLLIVMGSTAAIYLTILPIRNKVSCNSIMLAAMAIGTTNGLMMGTVLALTQPFSLNCILSILVGISTGLILGAMFNLMTTIEGILSGLMGGLMGAMLGEMLTLSFIYTISVVLIMIMGLVTVLLIKHLKQEAEYKDSQANLDLNKLTFIVAFSSLLLFSGILFVSSFPNEIESETHHHNH